MIDARRILTALSIAATALGSPCTATAETSLVVKGSRVELGELAPTAPEALRSMDLGPAPPPGGTALLDRERVVSQIRAAGVEPSSVALPRLLRVVGAARRWSPAELSTFVRGAVEDALPRGVSLTHLEARMPLVASPDALVGHAEIPRTPKHAGVFRTAIVVPIIADGEVATRVTLSATLDVSESAARPDVARGARITLVIDRRCEFRVDKTGRIVKARIEATDLASVISP